MDEQQAYAVAESLGGEPWNSGGGIWLVLFRRSDGRLVVLSDDVVCEYESNDAFEEGKTNTTIPLH